MYSTFKVETLLNNAFKWWKLLACTIIYIRSRIVTFWGCELAPVIRILTVPNLLEGGHGYCRWWRFRDNLLPYSPDPSGVREHKLVGVHAEVAYNDHHQYKNEEEDEHCETLVGILRIEEGVLAPQHSVPVVSVFSSWLRVEGMTKQYKNLHVNGPE